MITRVEFTLDNQTQITYQLINIQDIRSLFPKYEVEFTIHADNAAYKRKLYKQNYASYDHFHLRPWFSKHPGLKPGDKLAVEIVKPMEEYNLKMV